MRTISLVERLSMINRNFSFLFFLLHIFVTFSIAQQKIIFEQLSVPDGLSSNNVSDVYQDKYGYLWIATADGLNRYDGYGFDVFKYDPSDTLSLPASNITAVLEDKEGVIWAGSTDGLSRRDPLTGRFSNYFPETYVGREKHVVRIFEDSQNRLWIGFRWMGLYLFDRETKSFTRMKVKYRGAVQEYGGPVISVIETASGSIYSASSIHGFLKYNEQNKFFEIIDVGKKWQTYLENTFVWDLHEDKSGNLWMTTFDALFKYNPVQKTIQKIDLEYSGPKPGRYSAMYEDKEGFLWIASDAGIFRYNLRSGEVERYHRDNRNPKGLNHTNIWTLYEDSFGVLWICTIGGGLYKYDRTKIPFDKYTEFAAETEEANTSATRAMAPDVQNRNALWIGTNTGLWYLDRKKNFKKQIFLPVSINRKRINSIVADENDMLWIGTHNHGLLKYDILAEKFTHFSYDIYEQEGLLDERIYDIEQDDYGDIWIATQAGLNRLDPGTNIISRVTDIESRTYRQDVRQFLQTTIDKDKPLAEILKVEDFADETAEFSVQEKTDCLIIGTGEGLLDWGMVDFGWLENNRGDTIWTGAKIRETFHLSGARKNRIKVEIISLEPGMYKLRYLSDDSHAYSKWNAPAPQDSALWGIQILPIPGDKIDQIGAMIKQDLQRPTIAGPVIFELHYGRNGELWIGTNKGLSRYDPKSGNVKNYIHDPNDPSTLSDDMVGDIFEDRDGIFWLATARGLNRFDPRTETFAVYYEKDGLPSDQIRAIAEDGEGNLWISSINGITRFEKNLRRDKPLFINYDVQDGLQGYEFFWNSIYQYKDGELLFGGRNGLNAFYPGSISNTPPKVVLADLSISNEVIRPGGEDALIDNVIMDAGEINLSYDQNDLSFAFATIHFSRPAKNKVAYRLDGYQNDWISDNRRFVSFTNLDPGEYHFRIQGISGDGIPANEEATLKITINPPWWTTTWAYFLYGFVFVASIFIVDRVQRYRLTLRERNRAQIREAELRAQAAEAESKALQIEHERKTHELEEARKLQLSLLPEKLPELPNLEIAVYMKTATEVGGDYYDFNISADGTLNIALGDATGHGMRAGTMVTLMKGLFSADSGRMEIDDFFRQSSDTIKDLRFGRVMMSFTLLKIKENNMLYSSAGMPPAFIYRSSTLKMDELTLDGMPLGAMKEADYKVIQEKLEIGDTVLLLSDGLPELKNPNGESFDYPRVEKIFRDVADESAQAVIDRLVDAGEMWRKDTQADDDVTLMVIKVR
jgi:ligand-binding sensor domain-containing protein/serine phosphatase RsbU (regulator of sigma subunit)